MWWMTRPLNVGQVGNPDLRFYYVLSQYTNSKLAGYYRLPRSERKSEEPYGIIALANPSSMSWFMW